MSRRWTGARIGETEFALAKERLGGAGAMYAAAELVMVKGFSIAEAARRTKLSRYTVYEAIERIEKSHALRNVCGYCHQVLPEV